MKYLVMLLLALCVPAHAACLWSDPGAHRFIGDPVEAVRSYGDIPPKARKALAEAVRLIVALIAAAVARRRKR